MLGEAAMRRNQNSESSSTVRAIPRQRGERRMASYACPFKRALSDRTTSMASLNTL